MSNYICLSWTKKCLNNWYSEPFVCKLKGEFESRITYPVPLTCNVHKKDNQIICVSDKNILYHIKKTYVKKILKKLEKKNEQLG